MDAAATLGLGHPMEPLALQDLVGLDVTYAGVLSVYEETGDLKFLPPVLMKKMIAAGWLGRKSGKDQFVDHKLVFSLGGKSLLATLHLYIARVLPNQPA